MGQTPWLSLKEGGGAEGGARLPAGKEVKLPEGDAPPSLSTLGVRTSGRKRKSILKDLAVGEVWGTSPGGVIRPCLSSRVGQFWMGRWGSS